VNQTNERCRVDLGRVSVMDRVGWLSWERSPQEAPTSGTNRRWRAGSLPIQFTDGILWLTRDEFARASAVSN
jgi:hypothetical protein